MNTAELYTRRLGRYTAALRNGKPDCVPIRPFVAEFTSEHAGYTCQETAHDYRLGFAAARRCAAASSPGTSRRDGGRRSASPRRRASAGGGWWCRR